MKLKPHSYYKALYQRNVQLFQRAIMEDKSISDEAKELGISTGAVQNAITKTGLQLAKRHRLRVMEKFTVSSIRENKFYFQRALEHELKHAPEKNPMAKIEVVLLKMDSWGNITMLVDGRRYNYVVDTAYYDKIRRTMRYSMLKALNIIKELDKNAKGE